MKLVLDERQLADIIGRGSVAGVRELLREELMRHAEATVDEVLDQVCGGLISHLEGVHRDPMSQTVELHLSVNGLRAGRYRRAPGTVHEQPDGTFRVERPIVRDEP